jgi:hypothetical protein
MQSHFTHLFLAVAAFSIIAASTLPDQVAFSEPADPAKVAVWPQWRGPTRDGMVVGPAWPTSLQGEHLHLLWRNDLAQGYSSPIVGTDRVFTVESKGDEEIARAFDRTTGKQLWEASWKGSMKVPFFAARNGSWVRSTPAWDGNSVYVAGMRDVLVCLNAADGSQRWRIDFTERYKTPVPAFGFVCSPLVLGDGLYVQAGFSFLKLNKNTNIGRRRGTVQERVLFPDVRDHRRQGPACRANASCSHRR